MSDKKNKVTEELNKLLTKEKDILDAINESQKLQDKAMRSTLSTKSSQIDLYKLEKRLLREIADAEADGNKALSESLKFRKDGLKKQQEFEKSITKTRGALTGVNDQAKKLAANLKKGFESFPGGKALSRMLGIDTLADNFEESLNSAGAAYLKTFKETGSATKSMNAGMKAFGGSFKALLGPTAIFAAAIAGLMLVFSGISKKAQEFSTETGITFSQARLLGKEASDMTISLDANLSKTKDIKDVLAASISQFGILNTLSAEQAMNVSEIGLAFGYGAKEAGKVNAIFQKMGMSAGAAADAQRDLAAESLKAGVNVGAVVKDIAANAELTAKYFAGNGKALAKAGLEAAKLGMSISNMVKMSDSLLSFENSISAQYEFQALTGKQLNLDKARELALNGDIVGATKQIMDQVGSAAEFTKMNVVEREALAKATGMSVGELEKSLVVQEKLGELSAEEAASMANLGLSAAEMAGMSSEQLQNRLAEQQANERNSQAFAAMGNILINALMPAAQAISELFGALAPIIKMAFFPITLAAKGLGAMVGFMKEYSTITSVVAGTIATIVGLNKVNNMLAEAANAKEAALLVKKKLTFFFENNSVMKALTLSGIKETILGIETATNAQGKIGLLQGAANLAKSVASGAAKLGGAIAGIFSSFASIPFGLGVPLAIAAAGGLFALYKKATSVGDMGIDPNGGPVVTSPKLGGIFQGKKQDGLSMGPGMGTDPSTGSTNGGGSVSIDYQRMAQAIVKAMAGVTVQSAPIQIGAQVINAISDQIDVNKSYK